LSKFVFFWSVTMPIVDLSCSWRDIFNFVRFYVTANIETKRKINAFIRMSSNMKSFKNNPDDA